MNMIIFTLRRWIGIILLLSLSSGCLSSEPIATPINTTSPIQTSIPIDTVLPTDVSTPGNSTMQSINIVVDDFKPQPYAGESVYYFNRLEGDRGALNNTELAWGYGQVTATISTGNSWGGLWMSLNHPARENLSVNFSAVLPAQILPQYQSQITGVTVRILDGTPGAAFRIELKGINGLAWSDEVVLTGGQQNISFDLPALGEISQLVLVLDRASAGNFVVIENISFSAQTPVTDTATDAFVWSYGMLLNNWNSETGLVRDKAKDPSGDFDAIQSTGSLAAATAIAEQLGVVSRVDAVEVVKKIGDSLLTRVPRLHGLLPHWVRASNNQFMIVETTEWSSVDTVIAAFGLLGAQNALELDTSGTEQLLQDIDWDALVSPNGILHGYDYNGNLIPYAWDVFGGESWLVELAYASATGHVTDIAYPSPPTANGSGFIDELAWLYIAPPSGLDYWGTDWSSYRLEAVNDQILYFPTHAPDSCFASLGLFGLSAAEVPSPSLATQGHIYEAYGVGGQFADANAGAIALHYSAMAASLQPDEAIGMWKWLIDQGLFSPLTNVESLAFLDNSSCDVSNFEWNQLKGSWNLSLQALGWGRYLAEQNGEGPVMWQATVENTFLHNGYAILAPEKLETLAPLESPASPVVSIEPRENRDLLVWYDFEDDFLASGYVADKSGNGFDAQIIGHVNIDDGISNGNSISFFSNSYTLAQVNPAGERINVSFSLWFKTEHPENNYKLASAAWWNGGPGSGWVLATHIPEFWSDDTESLYIPDIVNNENYFASDEWIHEVVTYNGVRIKEYTNGGLINDWPATGAAIGQGQVMAVGAWPSFGFNFIGDIDEFQIFAHALTPQEVTTIYNQRR